MSVRTYNPSVRVGNWNEDLCLEEVREQKYYLCVRMATTLIVRDCRSN